MMNDLEAWYAWLDTLDAAGRNLAWGAIIGALSVSSTEEAWGQAVAITRGIVEHSGTASSRAYLRTGGAS